MHTRQGVAVPAQPKSTSQPSAKKPCASEGTYLSEVRALQSAQRADRSSRNVAALYSDFLQPGGMYPPASTADGRTAHAQECKAAFGRRDWRCHRCLELLRGAKPRTADYAPSHNSRQLRLL